MWCWRAAVLEQDEPVPDVWAEAAGVVRAELERRERERERALPPAPLRGLSRDALAVLSHLHVVEHGITFLVRLEAIVPGEFDFHAGFCELVDAGLLDASMAVNEDGDEAEVLIRLRYDIELPRAE